MRSFLCVYYGGSGSSWLMRALEQGPGVAVPAYEPLERWHWDAPDLVKLAWMDAAFSPPSREAGPERWAEWEGTLSSCPQFSSMPKRNFSTIGFKITEDAIALRRRLHSVLARHAGRLVFLVRENRVKHALSLYRSYDEGKHQFTFDGVQQSTVVDLDRFDRWLDHGADWHRRSLVWRDEAERLLGTGSVLTVRYEDVAADEAKPLVVSQVRAFLGVGEAASVPAGDGYRKATSDDLREAIVNYDEVADRYAGSSYGRWFMADGGGAS